MNRANFIPPRKPKSRNRRGFALIFLFIAIAAAVFYFWYVYAYGPVETRVEPDYGSEKPIFYRGELMDGSALGRGDSLKLPLPVVQSVMDPNIVYEEASASLILATANHVVRLQTDQLNAWVNERPFELRFPTEVTESGAVYVPIEPLKRFYGAEIREDESTGIVRLRMPGDVTAWAEVPPDEKANDQVTVAVRSAPSIRAGIVGELAAGARVEVWGERDGWYYVQLSSGIVGYADKQSLQWSGAEPYEPEQDNPAVPYVPKRPMGERIILTWEQVYTGTPNPDTFGPMPGLNVVSPTWFHLLDGEGALENRADANYVRWAHERDIQVWALFSNSFDPDRTKEAMSTYERRMNMARQLLSWAALYELDGINIDFENVHLEDGPKLTQFVRELTPLLHEAGLIVSIDVTFISTSPNWSMFYDRAALGGIVDYIVVMAYDEHWASSPVAGSVASLPWVEQGVRRMIEETDIPPAKLILGVPFYTRVWTEAPSEGGVKVSSQAVGMDVVDRILREEKLTPVVDAQTGQHYVEYEHESGFRKIWIEDEMSMRARAELVKELGLAGVGAWSRGFEQEEIWGIIDDVLSP